LQLATCEVEYVFQKGWTRRDARGRGRSISTVTCTPLTLPYSLLPVSWILIIRETNKLCPDTGNSLRAWRYSTSYSGVRALNLVCQDPAVCTKLPVLPFSECPVGRCYGKDMVSPLDSYIISIFIAKQAKGRNRFVPPLIHSLIHSLPGYSRVCFNEESVSRENVFQMDEWINACLFLSYSSPSL